MKFVIVCEVKNKRTNEGEQKAKKKIKHSSWFFLQNAKLGFDLGASTL